MKSEESRHPPKTAQVARGPSRRQKAIALRQGGFTFAQIAAVFGISRQGAHHLVNSTEVDVQKALRARRNRWMLALWRSGMDRTALAAKFEMTPSGVGYALRCAQQEEGESGANGASPTK